MHVEVPSSIKPTGWIGKEGPDGEKLPRGKNRTEKQIALGIEGYVNRKCRSSKATKWRERLWPGREAWRFVLAHGKLDHLEELPYRRRKEVELHDLRGLLA
jgi:hypothetical protein